MSAPADFASQQGLSKRSISLETILRDLGRLRIGIFFDDAHQPSLLITGQRPKGYALVGLNSRFAFVGRKNIVWRSWAHDGLRPL